jgi:hypothetical protein
MFSPISPSWGRPCSTGVAFLSLPPVRRRLLPTPGWFHSATRYAHHPLLVPHSTCHAVPPLRPLVTSAQSPHRTSFERPMVCLPLRHLHLHRQTLKCRRLLSLEHPLSPRHLSSLPTKRPSMSPILPSMRPWPWIIWTSCHPHPCVAPYRTFLTMTRTLPAPLSQNLRPGDPLLTSRRTLQ